ncbi:hypothetical protein IWQ62_000435 [Dispira parvispora]|uniref:Aminotransferase class I/classII large domain-containing protein n=1 Tax=Dispira parvispora TaxID=1520584 RepID=A0A9W8E9N2_9FUNG|nr:hypothetical protein IWQ62_000435 [Dispira parvispora]
MVAEKDQVAMYTLTLPAGQSSESVASMTESLDAKANHPENDVTSLTEESGVQQDKSQALDFLHLLGDGRRRTQTPIESLYGYVFRPDMLSLLAGLPHHSTFVFRSLKVTVPKMGQGMQRAIPMDESVATQEIDIPFFPAVGANPTECSIALKNSMQYGVTRGIKGFLDFAREHIQYMHDPPYADWDVIATIGNTDALAKAISLIGSPGDYLLVDEWTYPAAVDTARSHDVWCAPVLMDTLGMLPSKLDQLLSNWTQEYPGKPQPKMMYLVPTGQNPTGVTMPLHRRQAIYQLAQKHNLIIFEDDPYYYMQYASYHPPQERQSNETDRQPGLNNLIPSFLSLDTDGRVIRMDTFSKILAPGTRAGWITANAQFVRYIEYHNETTIQQPAGFSQAAITELLTNVWGHQGWIRFLKQLQFDYYHRRNIYVDMLQKHLEGMVEYIIPNAGMFVWLKLLLPSHRLMPKNPDQSIMEELFHAFVEAKVVVMPGFYFVGDRGNKASGQQPFLRTAFSCTDVKDFEPAVERMAQVLQEYECGKSRT